LVVDKEIQDLITKNVPSTEIEKFAVKKGFKTMFEDGREKVLKGETTVEELKRVIGTVF
jgi:type II secretory ATPase GspE/PulE/Tfp pilus assembly ATPase PilB-like protein